MTIIFKQEEVLEILKDVMPERGLTMGDIVEFKVINQLGDKFELLVETSLDDG